MNSVIVTVQGRKGKLVMDFDMPLDVDGYKLAGDLFEVLKDMNEEYVYSPDFHGLFINKTKKFLGKNETLGDAGVFNGDYLTILPLQC